MNTDNLVLRPNCLLTKYPLVFLTGVRSLFFYEKLGGFLQDFIAAHGYVVESPVLPFRSRKARKACLRHWLGQQSSKKFHFILSRNTFEEFRELFKNYEDSTFTIISKDLIPVQHELAREPLSYRLHRLICRVYRLPAEPFNQTLQDKSTEFYDRFLDHCIELAENESI